MDEPDIQFHQKSIIKLINKKIYDFIEIILSPFLARGLFRKIFVRKNISMIKGTKVIFDDNSVSDDIDLIIHSTEYNQKLSFLKNKDTIFHNNPNISEGLYFGFLPQKSNMFFVGHLYISWGIHWLIHEMQAKLIASCIKSKLSQKELLLIFKKDPDLLPYVLYNHGNNFSKNIYIDRYLDMGNKYLNIIKEKMSVFNN